MSETNPSDRDLLTGDWWAVTRLLLAARNECVDKKIKSWQGGVANEPVLRGNVLAAFGNLWAMRKRGDTTFNVDDFQSDWSRFDRFDSRPPLTAAEWDSALGGEVASTQLSARLLEVRGRSLFNIFFYRATEFLGVRSLELFDLTDPQFDTAAAAKVLEELQIPYRVPSTRRGAYAAQVLPCSGGLSPRFFACATRPGPDGRTAQSGVFSYWLGQPSLLHRLEDFFAGHLSGLLTVVDSPARDRPLGLLVVCSLLPEAFSKTDKRRIERAVKTEWAAGALPGIHPPPGSTAWCAIRASGELIAAPRSLRSAFVGLHRQQRSAVSYSTTVTRDSGSGESYRASIVRWDLLRAQFTRLSPTGPWLDSSVVQSETTADRRDVRIDVPRLQSYIDLWNRILEPGRGDATSSTSISVPPIMDLLRACFPERSFTSPSAPDRESNAGLASFFHSHELPGLPGKFLALLVDDPAERQAEQTVCTAIVSAVEKTVDKEELDEQRSVAALANLEAEWTRLHGTAETSGRGSTLELLRCIEQARCRAVIVLRKKELFLPREMPAPAAGRTAPCMTYSMFWPIVETMRILARDAIWIPNLEMPFAYTSKEGTAARYPDVEVFVPSVASGVEGLSRLVSALNWIGAPISAWGQHDEPTIRIVVAGESRNFPATHIEEAAKWLLDRLLHCTWGNLGEHGLPGVNMRDRGVRLAPTGTDGSVHLRVTNRSVVESDAVWSPCNTWEIVAIFPNASLLLGAAFDDNSSAGERRVLWESLSDGRRAAIGGGESELDPESDFGRIVTHANKSADAPYEFSRPHDHVAKQLLRRVTGFHVGLKATRAKAEEVLRAAFDMMGHDYYNTVNELQAITMQAQLVEPVDTSRVLRVVNNVTEGMIGHPWIIRRGSVSESGPRGGVSVLSFCTTDPDPQALLFWDLYLRREAAYIAIAQALIPRAPPPPGTMWLQYRFRPPAHLATFPDDPRRDNKGEPRGHPSDLNMSVDLRSGTQEFPMELQELRDGCWPIPDDRRSPESELIGFRSGMWVGYRELVRNACRHVANHANVRRKLRVNVDVTVRRNNAGRWVFDVEVRNPLLRSRNLRDSIERRHPTVAANREKAWVERIEAAVPQIRFRDLRTEENELGYGMELEVVNVPERDSAADS